MNHPQNDRDICISSRSEVSLRLPSIPEQDSPQALRGAVIRAGVSELLACEDAVQGFQLLESLTERIIDADRETLLPFLQSFPSQSDLLEKVAALDSFGEQRAARQALELELDSFDHYAWYLKDYYQAEKSFIEAAIAQPISHVSVIGHGAIPHSAFLFQDKTLTLIDIDPDVSDRARKILEQFTSATDYRFIVGDASLLTARMLRSNQGDPSTDSEDRRKEHHLAIIANAALPALLHRHEPLNVDSVFIRSATERGSLLYPCITPEQIEAAGYSVTLQQSDPLYDIHEWILCKPNQERISGKR